VADKAQVRAALYSIWAAPPLGMMAEQRRRIGVTGHSIHGTLADVLRAIGEFPRVRYELPPDLARGFTRYEARIAGHWRRDKNAPDYVAPQSRGAGPAVPPGAASQRDASEDLYSRGEGRMGERAEQLRVRGRAWSFLRVARRAWGGQWQDLLGDASDWPTILAFVDGHDE
jgi:hypothetical protein